MDLAAIAERLGITVGSARTYHGRAEQRRRAGKPRPGDLPPPDGRVGNSPIWDAVTIEAWIARRPGQGYGAGRPPKRRGASR
jgi:hypothetical protein